MWLSITANNLIYTSLWPVNTVLEVELQSLCARMSPKALSSCLCHWPKRRVTAWATGASRSYRKRSALGEEWMDHSPGLRVFVCRGQCVAFTGDSSLGSSDHSWEDAEWSSAPHVSGGWLGLELMVMGRAPFSEDPQVNSASHGSGWATERRGENKRCWLGGLSSFFNFEKRSFQLWIGPLSCKEQCQLTHI